MRSAPRDLFDDAAFQEVVVQDGLAYVADWIFGLRVVDLSDAADPTPVGAADTAGYPNAVTVAGDRAYIVEGTNGGWLRVLDVADPAHPAELAAMLSQPTRGG